MPPIVCSVPYTVDRAFCSGISRLFEAQEKIFQFRSGTTLCDTGGPRIVCLSDSCQHVNLISGSSLKLLWWLFYKSLWLPFIHDSCRCRIRTLLKRVG